MEAQPRLSPGRRVTRLVARALLLFLATGFIVLALAKFESVVTFSETIVKHGVVPASIAPTLAWTVPVVEILLSILTLWGLVGRGCGKHGGLALAGWMTLLTGYALYLTIHPPVSPAPCGCGMSQGPVESWSMIALRNAGLTFAVLVAAYYASRARYTKLT